MANSTTNPASRLISHLGDDENLCQLSDPMLLKDFNENRNELAFQTLLSRHGPMVWGVCRAALNCEADSEDAFQATFLILARKAGSIRKTESLGSWLHGVAYRTALKARTKSRNREKIEARASRPVASDSNEMAWREVQQILHEELVGLAEKYRGPLVVCYLEGMTQEEAAARIGIATSTLKERLERGREILRTRLLRRGLGSPALLTLAAWPVVASASIPVSLTSNTIIAAVQFANGQSATAIASAKVAVLTSAMLKTFLVSKLKLAGMVFVGIVLTGASATKLPWQLQHHTPLSLNAVHAGERGEGKKNLGLRPFDKGRLAKNLRERIPVFGRTDHEERERRGTKEDSSEPSRDHSMDEGKKGRRPPEPQFDRSEGNR